MKRIAAVAGLLVALAVASQFALPAMAEDRLRDDLARDGSVASVQISAFPALKLLFHRADRVVVHVDEARSGPARIADLLARTKQTDELDATADRLSLGPLLLRDLRLTKDGEHLDGEAAVSEADLTAALPVAVGLRPVEAADGALVLEATAGPLAVRARLSAADGALVIAPDGLLGGFASLTVFRDPRVTVEGVGARPRAGGFVLTASGRV